MLGFETELDTGTKFVDELGESVKGIEELSREYSQLDDINTGLDNGFGFESVFERNDDEETSELDDDVKLDGNIDDVGTKLEIELENGLGSALDKSDIELETRAKLGCVADSETDELTTESGFSKLDELDLKLSDATAPDEGRKVFEYELFAVVTKLLTGKNPGEEPDIPSLELVLSKKLILDDELPEVIDDELENIEI